MNERVQQALDGTLRREQLTAAEAAELAAVERSIATALQSLPTTPMPDLAPGILARIEALDTPTAAPAREAPAPRGLLGWLWNPRPVSWQFRPAYALAAAALLAVAWLGWPESSGSGTSVAQEPAPVMVLVQFRLDAPEASTVSLAGDFSDWAPSYRMTQSEAGAWQVFVPLTPGVHEYAFVIDGTLWQADPLAPAVADGFGGTNSRVAVLTGGERGL